MVGTSSPTRRTRGIASCRSTHRLRRDGRGVHGAVARGGAPTHVFVQAGVVHSLRRSARASWLHGARRPRFVIVEPVRGLHLHRSPKQVALSVVHGGLETVMGLVCGEVSQLAWEVLDIGAGRGGGDRRFSALDAVRWLASPCGGDPGDRRRRDGGARGRGALRLGERPELRAPLALGPQAEVLPWQRRRHGSEIHRRIVNAAPRKCSLPEGDRP